MALRGEIFDNDCTAANVLDKGKRWEFVKWFPVQMGHSGSTEIPVLGD